MIQKFKFNKVYIKFFFSRYYCKFISGLFKYFSFKDLLYG